MQEQLKSAKTIEQIAKTHKVSPETIAHQVKMGTKIEGEHTKNSTIANKIARQHVGERPDYYSKLKKMEKTPVTEDHKEIASGKRKDDEGYMARLELDQIERSIDILRRIIKKPDHQLPAWVQSKITRAADFIDTAAEYLSTDEVSESYKRIQTSGQMYTIVLSFMTKTYTLKMYFPTPTQPSSQEVTAAVQKVYPGGKVLAYYPCITSSNSGYIVANEQAGLSFDITHSAADVSKARRERKIQNLATGRGATAGERSAASSKLSGPVLPLVRTADSYEPEGEDIQENTTIDTPEKRRKNYLLNIGVIGETAAWTREEGKNKKGGLNEKGRKSYERENPGSDLKAPSKKVGNPRRASFCARMKGLKNKLTSEKTARDPNSRVNKSLRAWNC
jgi:hypothetical protein